MNKQLFLYLPCTFNSRTASCKSKMPCLVYFIFYLIFHISFSYFTVVLNLYYNPFYTEKTQKEFAEIKPCTEFSATNTLCTTIQHKIFMFFEMIKWKNCLLGLIFESTRFIQFRGDACCGIQIF